MYHDPDGEFVISTTALFVAASAALFATVGGLVGNYIANKMGATGWDKVGYIAGGAVIGGVAGVALGAVVAPAAAAATGIGGISITGAGVSTVAASGTTFGSMGTLISQNSNITVNWSTYTKHGLERMAERGITQPMVNTWVSTGKTLQQGADKFAFVTKQGMAVVTSAGKFVTTYSSAQYDAAMKEIIKKLFGG